MSGGGVFDVKIHYREPLHELWAGGERRSPYVASYRQIEAGSCHEAARIAEGRFREIARESRARWPREVVEVVVRAALGGC